MVFLTAKGSIYSIISNAEGGERGLVPYKQLGLISTICLSYRKNEGPLNLDTPNRELLVRVFRLPTDCNKLLLSMSL